MSNFIILEKLQFTQIGFLSDKNIYLVVKRLF